MVSSRYRIGQSKGLNAQTFPLEGAAEALRDLVGSRPFGRVLLAI
jgi:hypothetical protein